MVEIHDDHFPSDAKDEVWLAEVGIRGWIVLTKMIGSAIEPLNGQPSRLQK
jgi:hypothetical protein